MNYMTNKIVAIQGNHPSKLSPETDTSVFLAPLKQTQVFFLLMKSKAKTTRYFIMTQKIYR